MAPPEPPQPEVSTFMPELHGSKAFPNTQSNLEPCAEPDDDEIQTRLLRAVHPSTNYEAPATGRQCLGGWLYVLWIVLTPFLDLVWVIIPTQLILRSSWLMGPDAKWPQRILQWLEEMYFAMLGGLLEVLGGMDFVVTVEPNQDETGKETATALSFGNDDQVLLICNHRTEIDWIFFWNLAMRFNCQGRIRVMMKSVIRYFPGPGWAMLFLNYPYINRKWETDQLRIKQQIASYRAAASGSWLCMFPEGTALFHKTLERSHEFAKERGLPQWNYVLIPRTKGFELCVNELEPSMLLDVTVGYPDLVDGVRPSPLRLLRGQFPKAVHVHLKTHRRPDLEKHKGSIDEWLKVQFKEKEDRLRAFYESGRFPGHRITQSPTKIAIATSKGVAFHGLLCVATIFVCSQYPLATTLWFSFCIAVAVHRVHGFGE